MIAEPEFMVVGELPEFLSPLVPYLVVHTIRSPAEHPYKFVRQNLPLLVGEWRSFLDWLLCLPNMPPERLSGLLDLLHPSWQLPQTWPGAQRETFLRLLIRCAQSSDQELATLALAIFQTWLESSAGRLTSYNNAQAMSSALERTPPSKSQ
jgi:hypothetical protein